MGAIDPTLLLAALLVAATPILLAALGELVVERAGVLNLGVEGMMITGAICGFAVAVHSGSPALGFAAAAAGGAALSLVFAALTQLALANQVASGLALTLFGLGLSALLGQGYQGIKPPPTPRLDLGPLSEAPFLGQVLFSHDPVVYLALGLVAAVWAMLKYTRAGLILRAVGESHESGARKRGFRALARDFDSRGCRHFAHRVELLPRVAHFVQRLWLEQRLDFRRGRARKRVESHRIAHAQHAVVKDDVQRSSKPLLFADFEDAGARLRVLGYRKALVEELLRQTRNVKQ